MAYPFRPQTFTLPPPPPPNELRLGDSGQLRLDGGMSLKYEPFQLADNQSPYMPNMCADDKGELTKRQGQVYVYATSLGSGQINGIYERIFNGYKVFAWGTNLYKQSGTSQPVSLMSGLANSRGVFFVFGGSLYYLNGTNYVSWDGVSASASSVAGYIPTLTVSRTPTGGGQTLEALNLLQPGFKDSFSGDGTSTVYQLSQTNLDATTTACTIDGTAKTEGTDYTVNRTTGAVTFTAAPDKGTNNVIITAYKTISGYANRILNCTIATSYGGENDTRVFLAGNTNYPRRLFRSNVNDPTYFPDTAYQDVGAGDAITALAKQFDKLVILKQNTLWFTYYNNVANQGFWGAAGFEVNFPTAPLNSAIGCDMPGSVQIINNNIVFGNSDLGLFTIISTIVRDERVVQPVSGNINGNALRPGLLSLGKTALQSASSIDFGGKYYLCVGNVAYVWDYRLGPYVNTGNPMQDEERLPWFNYTNINASCWMQDAGNLYYGDRTNGYLVTFQSNFNDFGQPISAVWRSKTYNFNLPDWLKTVTEMWFTTRAGAYSGITLKYLDENGTVVDSAMVQTSSWSWAKFAWNPFSWAVSMFPPTIRVKPKVKKIIYFAVEFSNSNLNENLSILSLVIRYLTVKKVK